MNKTPYRRSPQPAPAEPLWRDGLFHSPAYLACLTDPEIIGLDSFQVHETVHVAFGRDVSRNAWGGYDD